MKQFHALCAGECTTEKKEKKEKTKTKPAVLSSASSVFLSLFACDFQVTGECQWEYLSLRREGIPCLPEMRSFTMSYVE